MLEPVLTLTHIRKAYKRHPVLRDCSMQIGHGETVAVVGENGSGKSTLLRITVGLLRPDGGQVSLRGKLGYCPQDLLIYDRLTVWENLVYFGAAYGMRRADLEAASRELFEQLTFGEYRDQLVATLSGGTKQKLNLTLALLHRPDILILDEPYQGFDYESYLAFLNLIDTLRSSGRAVLIVSHMARDNVRFDRILRLTKGTLTDEPQPHGDGRPDDAVGVHPEARNAGDADRRAPADDR